MLGVEQRRRHGEVGKCRPRSNQIGSLGEVRIEYMRVALEAFGTLREDSGVGRPQIKQGLD